MIADSLVHDWGFFVGAVAGLIVAVSAGKVMWTRQWKTISASVGDIKVTLDQAAGQVDKINTAVNNVPGGDPTLVQRVATLEIGQQWEHTALHIIASQIGVTLPATPSRARWFH